jgi:hypothetical protein
MRVTVPVVLHADDVQDTVVEHQVSTALSAQITARTTEPRTGTRIAGAS